MMTTWIRWRGPKIRQTCESNGVMPCVKVCELTTKNMTAVSMKALSKHKLEALTQATTVRRRHATNPWRDTVNPDAQQSNFLAQLADRLLLRFDGHPARIQLLLQAGRGGLRFAPVRALLRTQCTQLCQQP